MIHIVPLRHKPKLFAAVSTVSSLGRTVLCRHGLVADFSSDGFHADNRADRRPFDWRRSHDPRNLAMVLLHQPAHLWARLDHDCHIP